MRVLTIILCCALIGCAEAPKLEAEPLYRFKGPAVNTGKKPPVTQMREINGELYIY